MLNPSTRSGTGVPPSPLDLSRRALAMTFEDAALILTLAEEPELLLEPGETAPPISALDLAAARLCSAWELGRMLNAAGSMVQ